MLRIIAGEHRSRLLHTPPDADTTRPMTDRAKESIFNLLRGWFDDTIVLDLFAGVGSMGLEAVSRGSAMAIMIERDRDVMAILRRNIESLGVADRARAIQADALAAETLAAVPTPVQVVFVDPPYPLMEREESRARIVAQCERCAGLMTAGGFLVLRTPLDPAQVDHALEGFAGPEVHRIGSDMWACMYWRAASTAPTA